MAGLDFSVYADAPVVITTAATGLSNTVASLNGTANPNGSDTTAWFEWGLYAVNNTNLIAPVAVGSGAASVGMSNLLTGLTPGVNYHARLVASNAFGLVRGLDVLFGSPALALNGATNLTIGYQGTFTDPGATATGAPLAIAGGNFHSLALKSDGMVAAWGNNGRGQTTIPVGLSNVVAIAGGEYLSLALKSDGTVTAWGTNTFAQTTIPVGLSNVVAIAGGANHNLALKSDGTVAVWGDNASGQRNIPVDLSSVVAIAAGANHSLALKSDGTVVAWGRNVVGQTNIPVGLGNVVAIAGGGNHSLALKNNGTIVAWGQNNYGQTTIPAGLSNVVAIAGGQNHSLALQRDGTVAAWGANSSGQATIPVGLSNVVAIAGGGLHSLALQRDGTVTAWGLNNYDQTDIPVGLSKVAVTVGGSVDVNTPGTYILTYTSTNLLGGIGTINRTVVVAPPPTPPLLTGATRLGNGTFQFSFTNAPGVSFTLFATTNVALPFNSWSNLGPVVEGPAGQYQFTDPTATNSPQRFYGVRSP